MIRISFLILVLFTFTFFVQAQENPQAVKIAEFGDVNECVFSAQTDALFITLLNEPTARGFIINYRGLDFLPSQYENSFIRQNQILDAIRFRKFDKSRIDVIDGGFREQMTTELWLIPKGAENPVPTKNVPKPIIPTDRTYIYDKSRLDLYYENYEPSEFLLPKIKAQIDKENKELEAEYKTEDSADVENEVKKSQEETENERFFWANENFGKQIKQQNGAKGLMIFYADNKTYSIKKIRKRIEEGRDKIAKSADISSADMPIIFGGYRDYPQVDFWIIPQNGKTPKPTPEKR